MRLTPPIFSGLPKTTKALISAAAFVFVLELFAKRYVVYFLGLAPAKVLSDFWIWQTVSYIFVHGNFWHFFFNMLMLWIFGSVMENAMGKKEFLKYFLVTGAGAGIITILFSPHSYVPVVGASGSIYGLMIAFAVYYPDAKVYLYFLLPVSSRQMVFFLVVLELAMSFSGANPHVANIAHLGGMLVGYLYIKAAAGRVAWFAGLRGVFLSERTPSEEVNRILDKINKKGLNSLNRRERNFLDRYSGKS